MLNLGNVVGLVKGQSAPQKTYVLWGKVNDPNFPDIVELHYYDGDSGTWLPLKGNIEQTYLSAAFQQTSGGYDEYSGTFGHSLSSYVEGLVAFLTLDQSNSNPVKVDAGAGMQEVRRMDASGSSKHFAAGDLVGGVPYPMVYNGSHWILMEEKLTDRSENLNYIAGSRAFEGGNLVEALTQTTGAFAPDDWRLITSERTRAITGTGNTLQASDHVLLCDTSGGTVELCLANISSSIVDARTFLIVCLGENDVVITDGSGATINGASSLTLREDRDYVRVVKETQSNWVAIGKRGWHGVNMDSSVHDLQAFSSMIQLRPETDSLQLTGIVTDGWDGKRVSILNQGSDDVTLPHDSSSSSATHRFWNTSTGDAVILRTNGIATYLVDMVSNEALVLESLNQEAQIAP